MLKYYLLQELGGNCWRSDVEDGNSFSPSFEVFCYDKDIPVAHQGFGKRSHEIPSGQLERVCDGDGLECSSWLAPRFDVLTQNTLFDTGRA